MKIQTQFDENKVVHETECEEREYSPLKLKDNEEKLGSSAEPPTKKLKSSNTPKSIRILDIEDDGEVDSVSSAKQTEISKSTKNKPSNQVASKIV